MNNIEVEWDEDKARINKIKHGVTFAEAETAFHDPNGIIFDDPDHSLEEDRFILLGFSAKPRLLIVCHCYRSHEQVIRIISARKATRTEEQQYNDFQKGW